MISHFVHKNLQAQRSQVACLRLHSNEEAELDSHWVYPSLGPKNQLGGSVLGKDSGTLILPRPSLDRRPEGDGPPLTVGSAPSLRPPTA